MLRKLIPVIVALVFVGWIIPAQTKAQRRPNLDKLRRREVVAIRFEGDSAISSGELQTIIATRVSTGIELFLNGIWGALGSPRQIVKETTIDEDTVRLLVYYRNSGYFDAHARYELHESKEAALEWQKAYSKNSHADPASYPTVYDTVVFYIAEGKPYHVLGFTFEGFERLPMALQNQLTESIGIKSKSQYSKKDLIAETFRAKDILGEAGYPFLTLPPGGIEVDTDAVAKTVTLALKFKTGPRIKIGKTRFVYDTSTSIAGQVREAVLLRQLTMTEGEWFKNSERISSVRNISGLGTFQYVDIQLDTSVFKTVPDSLRDGLTIPVICYFRMHSAWEVTPGVPFGISTLGQGFLGLDLTYSNRNIFNGAEKFNAHTSYQILPWRTQHKISIGGDFTFPTIPFVNLKGVPLILSSNFSYYDQRRLSDNTLQYLERGINVSAGSDFRFVTEPTFSIPFKPIFTLQRIDRDYRDTSIFGGRTDTTIKPQFNVILSTDLSFDWTNDFVNPSKGPHISWTLQKAFSVSLGNLPSAAYLKNTIQIKEYFDLGRVEAQSIFASRVTAGLVSLSYPNEPTRDILLENRYYGGGTNSLRAWPARTLLVSDNSTVGRPQFGGYKMFEANIEWRYAPFQYQIEITSLQQFLSSMHIGFFCDAGNVWDKDVPIALKNFAVAVGTGMRYQTIIGVFRLDFGFKLYDPFPDPYLPGTKGADKSRENILAIPSNYDRGQWLWQRHGNNLWDVMNIEFALGQAF
ncbi:MAG: BamA/TamA family outer membrane protein [bacterium]